MKGDSIKFLAGIDRSEEIKRLEVQGMLGFLKLCPGFEICKR